MTPATRLLTAATLLLSLPAWAQDQPPQRCTADTQEACLNGVSSTVTGFDSLRNSRHRPIHQRRPTLPEKQPAEAWTRHLLGDESRGIGAWSAYTGASFEGDYRGIDGTYAGFEGDVDTLMIGSDWFLAERAIVGLAVGQERRDTATFYNGGGEKADGTTLMLYALATVTDTISVDASAGVTDINTDQRRIAPPPPDGPRPLPIFLTAQFDSNRYFGSLSGSWNHSGARLLLSGTATALYTAEFADGYTERGDDPDFLRSVGDKRVSLAQLSLGGTATWPIGAWDLYGLAEYRLDVDRNDGSIAGGLPGDVGDTQPADDDEYDYAVGLRYFGSSGFTVNGEFGQTLGRERYDSSLALITVRQDF